MVGASGGASVSEPRSDEEGFSALLIGLAIMAGVVFAGYQWTKYQYGGETYYALLGEAQGHSALQRHDGESAKRGAIPVVRQTAHTRDLVVYDKDWRKEVCRLPQNIKASKVLKRGGVRAIRDRLIGAVEDHASNMVRDLPQPDAYLRPYSPILPRPLRFPCVLCISCGVLKSARLPRSPSRPPFMPPSFPGMVGAPSTPSRIVPLHACCHLFASSDFAYGGASRSSRPSLVELPSPGISAHTPRMVRGPNMTSAPDRNRTYDTFFRREVLHPLSYWGNSVYIVHASRRSQ